MREKFKLIQVKYSLKPISFNLEFKCLIQDGDDFIWETIQNRIHKCDFNNKSTMNIRQFQKYEISNEFFKRTRQYIQAKCILIRVLRLNRSKDYDPFDNTFDSSDKESLSELTTQIRELTNISINQLEIDWKQLIKSHFECKQKLK